MCNPKYPRGSEWRKWDLQVHTPFSALNNGFGDDFNLYTKNLLKSAIEKKIAVIGVTDYFSIEGYKNLKALMFNRRSLDNLVGADVSASAQKILLLPNIEFRTSTIIRQHGEQDSRVNFHVIFSDEIEPDIINDHFLRELKFTVESNPNSKDERWSLTIKNLEDLGKRLKEQHINFRGYSDLYVGMLNAVVSHEEVTEVLERQPIRFKDRFLIAVPVDEDLSKCSWNGQAHLARKLFIQKSHILLSSNPKTRDFGLGKKHPLVQDFITEFGSLKACLHSSDSHNFSTLFEPTGSRYTWIKADPTFKGLCQLLNEPEDRVFIGIIPPSLERVSSRSTKVINELNISKIQNSSLKEKWFDCHLDLNPELVAIIGNKGNGKSALADILGLLGNTPRYNSFSFLKDDRFRDPKNNKAKHFSASLTWADRNHEGPITLDSNSDLDTVEKIKFIPQNYLEEICNEVVLGKGSRFYSELQQVIFSHVPEPDRLGFDTLDELLDHRGAEINKAIEILVVELKDLNKQIVIYEEKSSLQYKRNLESQLAEKRRELKAHEKAKPVEIRKPEIDQIVQNQSKKYSDALDKKLIILTDLENEIRKLRDDDAHLVKKQATAEILLEKLKNLKRQIDSTLLDASAAFNELGLNANQIVSLGINTSPINAIIRKVEDERVVIKKKLDPDQKDSVSNKQFAVLKDIEELKNRLTAPQREYQVYLQKLQDWKALKEGLLGSENVIGSISYLENLLKELNELPMILKKLSQKRNKKALEIYREKQRLRKYFERYYGAVQNFLCKHPLTAGESLKVTFNVSVAQSGFFNLFLGKINQRKVGSFSGVDEGSAELKFLIDSTNWDSPLSVLRFTQDIMKKLNEFEGRKIEIKDQLKHGESPQDVYDLLFSFEYLSPIYRLTWEGKGLEQLSPGERGNLLLIFYLLVDRDDIPFVIDQPEENLDNQTVVRTLVPCVKDAKKRRQIIMVTHNPNLAVVCDAEQVIYAEIHRELDNEVRYISGSIEDPVINKKIVDVLEGTRPAFDKRDSKYYI